MIETNGNPLPRNRMTHPRRMVALELAVKVLELRLSGMRFRGIAKATGRPLSVCYNALQRGLDEFREESKERIRVARALESVRLDELHKALWDRALKGNLRAVERVLKIMERRARLFGLDAPARITTPPGSI
jgi:hypothetical protein